MKNAGPLSQFLLSLAWSGVEGPGDTVVCHAVRPWVWAL